ncbi:MAG: hypothetical protein Q8O37_01740, partial [Sulfuricellaceae bacterium]|nr:hypothetical protein [Sulfuricellaceae bacterium]
LQNILCQIDPNCRNLHFGRLSSSVEISHLHFGTWMPLGEGATIPLVNMDRKGMWVGLQAVMSASRPTHTVSSFNVTDY